MFVLVNGLPFFGKNLVKDLNDFDSSKKYVFLNTYYSKWDKFLFFILLPFSGLVISFNGVSDYSGTLNWAMKWKKKMIMQWQGSDVMLALERNKNQTILNDYIDYAIHFTDFDFLANELNQIGIKTSYVPFKHLTAYPLNTKYKKVSVLSYVGLNNEDLYGLNEIIEAANQLIDIDFHIIGTEAKHLTQLPNNVFVYGWQSKNKVIDLMKENAIFLRMTKHDGNALSVAEALSFGCEVIWSYPSKCTYQAKNTSELVANIRLLKSLIEERKLTPNFKQSETILKNYERRTVIANYINKINSIL